jgi:hypothetical protein
MVPCPADVVVGGRYKIIRTKLFFGVKLQVRQEAVREQALFSKRTTAVRREEKQIAKERKQQAFFESCDKTAMRRYLGLSEDVCTNNENSILLATTAQLREAQLREANQQFAPDVGCQIFRDAAIARLNSNNNNNSNNTNSRVMQDPQPRLADSRDSEDAQFVVGGEAISEIAESDTDEYDSDELDGSIHTSQSDDYDDDVEEMSS